MKTLTEARRIMRAVQGFQGYQDKDLRDGSNRALLEHLSNQLVLQMNRVACLQIELAGMGESKACAELDRGILRFQILLSSIGLRCTEKAPWLDLPRIEQDNADTLCRIDSRLLDLADIVAERVSALERAFAVRQSWPRLIGEMIVAVDAVGEALANRREIIRNLLETNVG